jgi:CPA2 family monovalent cation:H+ antiporter-2/glutathione-regulated potassium-efflux system protein KefB
MSVGMMLDLSAIADRPLFVLGMAVLLITVKTAVMMVLGLLFRMPWRSALALGLLLSQGGEFGFVLFAQAQNGLIISPEAVSLFSAIVTISMVTTPFLMAATQKIREAPISRETRERPRRDGASALVVGYGRFGQTVAQMLIAAEVQVTLIDMDVEMIDVAGSFGAKVYFGDGTRLDLLRQAGAGEAQVIAFCIDGEQLTAEFIHAVHKTFPDALIYVRAYDRRSVLSLSDAPVRLVVRELIESAAVMARGVLEGLDVSLEDIDRAEDIYRSRDRERLVRQAEAGDIRAARDQILVQPERDAQ